MIKVIMSILFLFSVASCTSLSEQECATANWYKKGMADAKAGKPKSTLGSYKDACLRRGIEFDTEEYIEGFEKGLGN